ncbi:helix-turn-helix domain-containing protein [Lachnospiraceae bacterium 47-T17]
MKSSDYISVREAARKLGVSTQTIRNLILKHHAFKAKRIGRQFRISKKSFEKYVRECSL